MKKISVLIVDDNEADRYLLRRQLDETNLDVVVYEEVDGEKALNFFLDYDDKVQNDPDEFPPLIVFLDINMPMIDGFEFLEKFKPVRDQYNIETSFIMMFTTSEKEEDKKKSFEFEFVKGFLTKGQFSSEQLQTEIEKFIA